MLTKELLAKYMNSYEEVMHGKKPVIAPHFVVRGSQKNYVQFLNYNFESKPDNIYFEDAVAKAILFQSAEKIYGIKPNAIGDLRYITVPYSIAWLGFKLKYKLDLYRIWKNQEISEILGKTLYKIMVQVEEYIKRNAPGSLYGEWAKKEDCWNVVKEQDFAIDLSCLQADLEDKSKTTRKRISSDETEQAEIQEAVERIKSVHPAIWKKIESWGRETGKLTQYQYTMAGTIGSRLRNNRSLTDVERNQADDILDIVIDNNAELFYEMDSLFEEDERQKNNQDWPEITLDLINKIVQWDKKHKRLKIFEYKFMTSLAKGEKPLTERNKIIANLNLEKARKFGFSE